MSTPDRLPFLPAGIPAGRAAPVPLTPWRAIDDLALALGGIGRAATVRRQGLPPREQVLAALRAMQKALDGWVMSFAEGEQPEGTGPT